MAGMLTLSLVACGGKGGASDDGGKQESGDASANVANKDKPLVWFNRQPSNSSTGELDMTALSFNDDTYYVGFDANQGAELQGEMVKEYIEAIKSRIAPFNDIPIIFTSVINRQRILDVLNAAAKVYENYSRKVSTSKLNDEMLPEIENYPPPAWKGKYIKIKYVTQLPTRSPSFAFFCNLPQYVKEPYKRFLENKLRSKFDFSGCPIQIYLRQK